MNRFHHVEELIDVDLRMFEFLSHHHLHVLQNEPIQINKNRLKKNLFFTLDFVPESFL